MTINLETFKTFEDITNPFLRSYNRFVTAMNITEDMGEEESRQYLGQFEEGQLALIQTVGKFVRQFGVEEVKRQAHEAAANEMIVGAGDVGA